MSCGLKKQLKKETGVSLTERTCSPYNPIIKQMVDDCLGLPIYPVSSIDAIIDENGTTLRKLLEDLIDSVNGGDTNINLQIDLIIQAIQELQDNSSSNEDFLNLEALVNAISSLTDVGTNNLTIIEPNSDTPVIVGVLNRIIDILGRRLDPTDPNTLPKDSISDQLDDLRGSSSDLAEDIDLLKGLIIDIANFNRTAQVSTYSDLPSLTTDDLRGGKLNIIYYLVKAIFDIENLYTHVGTNLGFEENHDQTLTGRVEALEHNDSSSEDVEAIEQYVGLDPNFDSERLDNLTERIEALEGEVNPEQGHEDGTLAGDVDKLKEVVGDCQDNPNTLCTRVGALEDSVGERPSAYNNSDLWRLVDSINELIGNGAEGEGTLDDRITTLERLVGNCDPEVSEDDDLCTRVDALEGNVGTYDDTKGSVETRLENLETNSAHLDDELLSYDVKKLEASEYPVTAIYNCENNASFVAGFNAAMNGQKVLLHLPLGTRYGILTSYDPTYMSYDYDGNGVFDLKDIHVLANYIVGRNEIDNPSIRNLDPNGDGSTNEADINYLIELILSGKVNLNQAALRTSASISKYILELHKRENDKNTNECSDAELIFNRKFDIIKHPIIVGKLYADIYTQNVYICEEGSDNDYILTPIHVATEKSYAKLEKSVLNQIGNNKDHESWYRTLAETDIPPQGIYINTPFTLFRDRDVNKVGRIEYGGLIRLKFIIAELANANPEYAKILYADIYPFGHTDQTKGRKLYYKDQYGGFHEMTDQDGVTLRAGDGYFSVLDPPFFTLLYNKFLYIKSHWDLSYYGLEFPHFHSDFNNYDGYIYCKDDSNHYYRLGNVEFIPGTSDADDYISGNDIVDYIDLYFTLVLGQFSVKESTQDTLGNTYTNVIVNDVTNIIYDNFGNVLGRESTATPQSYLLPITDLDQGEIADNSLYYYPTSNPEVRIKYPCIEGRLYVDNYTGDIYRFSKGTMHKADNNIILAGNGLTLTKVLNYDTPETLTGPYYTITISLDSLTKTTIDRAAYVNGGVGLMNEAIAHINPDYSNLTFEWTLLDANNEFDKLIRFVPSSTNIMHFLNPDSPDPQGTDTVGTFVDISDGTTVGSAITYEDLTIEP